MVMVHGNHIRSGYMVTIYGQGTGLPYTVRVHGYHIRSGYMVTIYGQGTGLPWLRSGYMVTMVTVIPYLIIEINNFNLRKHRNVVGCTRLRIYVSLTMFNITVDCHMSFTSQQ